MPIFAGSSSEKWASVLDGHPDVDGVVRFPGAAWRDLRRSAPGWRRLVPAVLRWVQDVRGLGAGLAIDFHGNLRSGIIARLTGARVRLGHAAHQQKEGNRFLTTHRIDPGPERRRSRVERHLALVRALGVVDEVVPDAGLRSTPQERAAAREAVRATGAGEDRPYAILNPGASAAQAYKQPPPSLLAAAARPLAERGIVPVVIHGPGEEARFVKDRQIYVITYEVENAILFFNDHDELYWNVTGNDWKAPIEEASANVSLALKSSSKNLWTACYTGPHGSKESQCGFDTYENGTKFLATRKLNIGEGFTIAFGWDKGLVSPPSSWRKFFWAIDLRENWVFLFPPLALLFMIFHWRRRGRDPKVRESLTVMYEPPKFDQSITQPRGGRGSY